MGLIGRFAEWKCGVKEEIVAVSGRHFLHPPTAGRQ